MPTFLTTPRMSPALAARVEASVRGRRGEHRPPSRSLGVSLLRVGFVAAVLLVVGAVLYARQSYRRELEAARTALLDTLRTKSAALTDRDRGAVTRDEAWLTRLAGSYEGDFVAPELRDPATFAAMLARPAVYVRGPLSALASTQRIADAASSSMKDPLLVCLLDPPAARTEKALLAKVREVYGTALATTPQAPNVSRFAAAEAGLPFLLPPWAGRVRAAQDPEEIEKLDHELSRAPVEEAKRAVKADVLVAAMDEPGDGSGPTELDGERAHFVRVGIVDLAADKVLLRVRKHVEPSWISEAKRPQYAAGLDGCGLAMDVRDTAIGAVPFRSSRL
jgi:hypothetical protein